MANQETVDGRFQRITIMLVALLSAAALAGCIGDEPERGDAAAAFDYDCQELTCTFDATAYEEEQDIMDIEWVFGDHTFADGALVEHTFDEPGTYDVELYIYPADAPDIHEFTHQIQVEADEVEPEDPDPVDETDEAEDEEDGLVAAFDVDCLGPGCTFDAGPSERAGPPIQTYAWDFGDGSTEEGPRDEVKHTYFETGTHTVTLTITDENDATDTTTKDVEIPYVYEVDTHWIFEIDEDERLSPPTVTDDAVYVPSSEGTGKLYELDTATGQQGFEASPIGSITAPLVWQDLLFVGGSAGPALDKATGEVEWEAGGFARLESLTIEDGVLYFGLYSHHESVHAHDAATGDEQWTASLEATFGGLTVADGTVLVGSHDGLLTAFDADTGQDLWTFETEDAIRASPVVHENLVLVASQDDHVYALDLDTGEEEWTFEASIPWGDTLTLYEGTAYLSQHEGQLLAFNPETGEEEWTFETVVTSLGGLTNPTVTDGTVYVGDGTQRLYTLDADTGEEIWHYSSDIAGSVPAVHDGVIYLAAGNQLHAMSPSDA